MVIKNIKVSPSTPLLEEQKVVAQPQNLPKSRQESQIFSSTSAKPYHPGNKMSFGQTDQQGLLGSSEVRFQENPKLLEDSDKETRISRSGPSVLQSPARQIVKNKEAGAVIIKSECSVPRVVREHSLRNEKQKQLQDSFAPTFPQMKLAYQPGLLGSSRVRLQENPKLLEDLDKETSMSRRGPSVLQPPEHQIAKNKQAGAVVINSECFIPPMVPVHSFGNEKLANQQGLLGSSRVRLQENPKLLEDSDKETSKSRPSPSVLRSPDHQIAKNKESGAVVTKRECFVPPMIPEHSLRKGKQKQVQDTSPPTFPQMNLASQPPSASLMIGPSPPRVSQMNLQGMLRQQMKLSRTYDIRPEVMPGARSIRKPGMCVQRLNQFIYRQQQRPRDNNLEFWRNLVAEFFAPKAKKRLCFSSNRCRQQIGSLFPQVEWCCDICKVRPTAGFEISAEVLPRLCKIKYETGMLDELLNMGIPEECYTPSGHIVLNSAKVTKESVYEAARVVHEGRLRVVFSSDLKICAWEFCCSFHEVLINRSSVTPQVHQLTEAIQIYQAFAGSCSGIATEEFRANTDKFASSISQLARVLDKSVITELGYTKRYVRCLQISEIVSSMKFLMDYSKKYGIGPAVAMARIHRQSTASRVAPMHNSVAEEGPRQPIEQEQPYNDSAISQDSSVISTDEEGPPSLSCSPRATSPTCSTASSKRPVHQADLVSEPKRIKTNSGESSVLFAPTELVLNQPISTTPPFSSIRSFLVQPSSANVAAALIDTNVLHQNVKRSDDKIIQMQNSSVENKGKYCYGFETAWNVDKSYYMDQLENLNGESLFPAIHIGSPLIGTSMVNDTHSNNQQFGDQLPYWEGKMESMDDIQFN